MSTLANSKFHAIVAAAVIAVASLAPASRAQTAIQLRANVPFAFQFGSHHYPAGSYTVKSLSEDFVLLSSKAGRGVGMVENSYGKAPATGKLVFNRYGNHYFLEEIWAPNTGTHLECIKTSAERQISRELILASRKAVPPAPEEVALR
jgi:hypothetical protein